MWRVKERRGLGGDKEMKTRMGYSPILLRHGSEQPDLEAALLWAGSGLQCPSKVSFNPNHAGILTTVEVVPARRATEVCSKTGTGWLNRDAFTEHRKEKYKNKLGLQSEKNNSRPGKQPGNSSTNNRDKVSNEKPREAEEVSDQKH